MTIDSLLADPTCNKCSETVVRTSSEMDTNTLEALVNTGPNLYVHPVIRPKVTHGTLLIEHA